MAGGITTSDIYKAIYTMSDTTANARSKAGSDTKGEVLDYLDNPGYQGISSSKINPNTTAKALDNSRFFKMNIKMARGKEVDNGQVSTSSYYNATLNPMGLVDIQWITSRFMAPSNSLIDIDRKNRFFSTARYKAQSTKMGCHIAMNPRPQFTRFADIKGNNYRMLGDSNTQKSNDDPDFESVGIEYPKTFNNKSLSNIGLGMGRYYSEAIDDNATTIFLEFGVPKFNSILGFLTRAVSLNDQIMASTGRYIANNIGSVIGTYVGFCAFPLIGTILFIGKTITGFLSNQPFSYYYLLPTMHTYWSSVSNILSQIMVEMGFLNPRLINGNETQYQDMIGVPMKLNKEDLAGIAQYFPQGFIRCETEDTGFLANSNYVDVFAVAGFQQRIAYEQSQQVYDFFSSGDGSTVSSSGDLFTRLAGYVQYGEYGQTTTSADNLLKLGNKDLWSTINNKVSLAKLLRTVFGDTDSNEKKIENQSYFKRNLDSKSMKSTDEMTVDGNSYPSDTTEIASSSTTSLSKSSDVDSSSLLSDSVSNDIDTLGVKDKWSLKNFFAAGYSKQFDSVMRDGVKWAILNVDYNGEQTDSFSNSYSDIDIGVGVKSASAAARSIAFNAAGGNVIPGLDNVVNAVKDIALGFVDGATFGLGGVLASIFNGAYIDLPKKWDDSNISVSSTSYSIDLVSPYGNPFSQVQNIYLPLSMLLAGCLPLYAGEAAYVSPFLCNVFNKGVQMVRLGMITSMSITRGTGNLGFNKSKRPLGFRVTFTISDFSNIMTAPINASIGSQFKALFRSDSKFSDYLGLLVARDLYTHTYFKPKALMRFSLLMMGVSQIISPYQWATRMEGTTIKSVINAIVGNRIFSLSQYNATSTINEKGIGNNVTINNVSGDSVY